MNDYIILFPISIFLLLTITLCYGIYSDHIYKMKKLELIERGIIKEFKE